MKNNALDFTSWNKSVLLQKWWKKKFMCEIIVFFLIFHFLNIQFRQIRYFFRIAWGCENGNCCWKSEICCWKNGICCKNVCRFKCCNVDESRWNVICWLSRFELLRLKCRWRILLRFWFDSFFRLKSIRLFRLLLLIWKKARSSSIIFQFWWRRELWDFFNQRF